MKTEDEVGFDMLDFTSGSEGSENEIAQMVAVAYRHMDQVIRGSGEVVPGKNLTQATEMLFESMYGGLRMVGEAYIHQCLQTDADGGWINFDMKAFDNPFYTQSADAFQGCRGRYAGYSGQGFIGGPRILSQGPQQGEVDSVETHDMPLLRNNIRFESFDSYYEDHKDHFAK